MLPPPPTHTRKHFCYNYFVPGLSVFPNMASGDIKINSMGPLSVLRTQTRPKFLKYSESFKYSGLRRVLPLPPPLPGVISVA